jgi:redox-sensitive bicupin YhaK (pirin superfamily)
MRPNEEKKVSDVVALTIPGRMADLGDFSVRRVLPYAKKRRVGPFVFFDQMGPLTLLTNETIDVRPHPHINLATVTYLFRGEMLHRDSLGCVQTIRPGDVNWMTAGRGIVHSERTAPDDLHKRQRFLHGIQAWVALPVEHEETAPEFHNHARRDLPSIDLDGVALRLIAGRAYGAVSPVKTFSDMFYLDVPMGEGQRITMPVDHPERAFYVVDGTVECDGASFQTGQMAVLTEGADAVVMAATDCHVMLLGGAPLDGERHMWWNFVSSRPERIEQAKRDWAEGRYASVPGESDFIPLPE